MTNGLTGTTWTDTNYWAAEPVLEPMNYWVVANGGGFDEPESNRVETRHRHGVFVGVDKFKDKRIESLPRLDVQAELFGGLAREKGGFPSANVKVLTGSDATKSAVRKALQDVASKAQTGDYVVIFCNSHGRGDWLMVTKYQGIVMYDSVMNKRETLYTKEELAEDLETLAKANGKKGLNVVVLMNTCHGEGAVAASPEGQNFAWIVACRESEGATHKAPMGAVFSHFLLQYGWNWGGGVKGSGTMVSFKDLVDYALPAMEKLRGMKVIDEHAGTGGNHEVLKHFIAGRSGVSPHESAPRTPTGVVVTNFKSSIGITWDRDDNAEYFICLREDENTGECKNGMVTEKEKPWINLGKQTGISYHALNSYRYRVAALNEHGISEWSELPLSLTFLNEFFEWLKVKYVGFHMDATTPVETVAAVAASPSENGMSYEECYVAGVDPNDPDAALRVEFSEADGKRTVGPVGGEKEGRRYWVEGKREMMDEEWEDLTGVEDLQAEGWRFFRLVVELEE